MQVEIENGEILGWFTSLTALFGYSNLFIFGHFRDFIDYLLCRKIGDDPKVNIYYFCYKKIFSLAMKS